MFLLSSFSLTAVIFLRVLHSGEISRLLKISFVKQGLTHFSRLGSQSNYLSQAAKWQKPKQKISELSLSKTCFWEM